MGRAYEEMLEEAMADEKSAVTETVDKPVETPAEPEETPEEHVEDTGDKPEDTPAEDRDEPEESPEEKEKPEEKPFSEQRSEWLDSKPKKDLSGISKEEKAEHAFRKQLAKQKERHAQEIEELKGSFSKQLEDFKNEMKAKTEPEKVKTREDFPPDAGGDDQYITYLAERKVNAIMAERDEKAAKERAAQEERDRAAEAERTRMSEMKQAFGENCRRAFPEENSFREFTQRVDRATENGLGAVLDNAPVVRNFVFGRPEGPRVLDRLLSDRDTFRAVFSERDPMMQTIALVNLAQQAQPVEPGPVDSPMPKIGKPGSRGVSRDDGGIFGSDESLVKFIRQRGRRMA